jgi:hypothetical protein
MNTEERHSFLIGLFETLCPWKPRYRITQEAEYKPDKEYHYYLGGRAVGFAALLALSVISAKLAFLILAS